MRARIAVVSAGFLLFVGTAVAQTFPGRSVASAADDAEHELLSDQFTLFTSCAPVMFGRVVVSDEALADSLNEYAKDRLRVARLLFDFVDRIDADDQRMPISVGVELLEINVGFWLGELSIGKLMYDPVTDLSDRTTTWRTRQSGQSSKQLLSDLLDEFILEYLRVNEPACT